MWRVVFIYVFSLYDLVMDQLNSSEEMGAGQLAVDNAEVSLVPSQRGGTQLCLSGYMYNRSKKIPGKC